MQLIELFHQEIEKKPQDVHLTQRLYKTITEILDPKIREAFMTIRHDVTFSPALVQLVVDRMIQDRRNEDEVQDVLRAVLIEEKYTLDCLET